MSRAFLKDSDSFFCREKNRECILAAEDGACGVNHCKYERRPPAPAAKRIDPLSK